MDGAKFIDPPHPSSHAKTAAKGMLRLIACGGVDDGKSTLIGRLLHDTGNVAFDRLALMSMPLSGENTTGRIDMALIADGLQAEREQAITIDVAHLYFETKRRKYILMDCPGHEQYTRNMATGASGASLAILLIDARVGAKPQTRRHLSICAMFGITQIIIAINKMDCVGYDRGRYEQLVDDVEQLASIHGIRDARAVPIVATEGDNVAARSHVMSWYSGPLLVDLLDQTPATEGGDAPFCMPVQWINRSTDFRGYAGSVALGKVSVGDVVRVLPGEQQTVVRRIVSTTGDVQSAKKYAPVTLTLDHDVDIARGDVLVASTSTADVADIFAVNLAWFGDKPLRPNRSFVMRIGTRKVSMRVTRIKYKIDIVSGASLATVRLDANDIGRCDLETAEPIPFDVFRQNPVLGGFVVIDRISGATVGGGTLLFALRRAHNVSWEPGLVDQTDRSAMKRQQPLCVWMTGLPGAGKSTLATLVEEQLIGMGRHTYLLDGDNLRHGLNADLSFTEEDRIENVRRIAEVARLMVDAGLTVLVCAVSPFAEDRAFARSLFSEGRFIEVFVDTPLAECERRDPKGLYRKAREGEIPNFTGVGAPYEAPSDPEVRVQTLTSSAADIAADLALEINRRTAA